jgi:hypothetical protein
MENPEDEGWTPWDGTATAMFGQRYDVMVEGEVIYGAVAEVYDDGEQACVVFAAPDGSDLPDGFDEPDYIRPHGSTDTVEAATGTKH